MKTIEIVDVKYAYNKKKPVLRGITAGMEAGKLYAILGPSGCGKTTLLSLIGGLDEPTDGKILFGGKDIAEMGLDAHRKQNVAFVFQSYNLIDYMTPIENVRLTAKTDPVSVLSQLGIQPDEMKRNVLRLSGGQQQRVAIARALASDVRTILADEPTGNLDEDTAAGIIEVLKESAHKQNKCVIVVTHSIDLAQEADVVFELKKGAMQVIEHPEYIKGKKQKK